MQAFTPAVLQSAGRGNPKAGPGLKLIIQPEEGIAPILSAIKSAKSSIETAIFRCDRREIDAALKAAVGRGVFVHALIAYANRGGEQRLRQLEMRLLAAGATVTRTVDDLIRYHDKMMLIDRRVLCVFSFNYTTLDLKHSRGFGLVTRNKRLVQEGIRLFEADSRKQPYTAALANFLVSPLNARKVLADFIRKARKELLIYDPKISDREMIRLLQERAKAGVEVKIIGRLGKPAAGLAAHKLSKLRLHTRTILRDRRQAFIGSQSLRKAELDSRRELGLIVQDPSVVGRLVATFESDWASKDKDDSQEIAVDPELQKKVDVIVGELPPLASTVKRAVKKAVAKAGQEALADDRVKQTVKKVVKKAVKDAVKEVVEEASANGGGK